MATQSTTLWNQFKGDLGEGPYREKGHRKDLYTSVFSKEGDDAGASGDIREDVSGSTTKPLVQNSADIPGNGDRTAFYRRKRERYCCFLSSLHCPSHFQTFADFGT